MKRIVRHSVVLGAFAILSSLSFPAFADSSSTVDLEFTFASSLTTTLSSADIFIHDITPGTSKNSNSVNLNVTTNNISGYVVSASTGDANNNSSDLIQTGITDKFSSIAASANLESLTTDDTWGYSTKVDTTSGNGTSEQTVHTEGTWSNLNGLATTSAPIYSTNSPLIADVNFRIAARASEDIEPGEYTNTINFFVVANPAPVTFSDAFAGAGKTKLNNYYKMQDMSPSICNAVVEGAQTQLIDDRDNKTYWVLKAKDGKCWMTQNLDHDIVAQENYYTPANTDISANWTPISTAATMSAADMSTDWTSSNTSPESVDTGDWYWDGNYSSTSCDYLSTACADFSSSSSTFSNSTHGHVGNYYNWTAAIASNDSSSITSGNADDSICPAGWRLPTGGDGSEFAALNAQYGNTTNTDANIITSPLHFVRGGNVNDGSLVVSGERGYYWSSTTYDNNGAYRLGFNPRSVGLENANLRKYGFSVRCVARESEKADPGSFEYGFASAGKSKVTVGGNEYYQMQDMTSSICATITTGQTGTLVDIRDGGTYRVGKLQDNKCWLLDNLALDLTNTDVKNTMYDSSDSTHDTMTNATNTQLGYLFNGGRNSADTSTVKLPTAGVANWTSGSSYSAPLVNMTDKDVVTQGSSDPLAAEALAGDWKVGGYYNYCAASAGSYCYGNGTSQGSPSGNATADICPSGWRMPTGGASGEYQALATIINGASGNITDPTKMAAFRSALSLPFSGYFRSGAPVSQGSVGSFWSSTYGSTRGMSYLYIGTSRINAQGNYNRDTGYSVRCIAQ